MKISAHVPGPSLRHWEMGEDGCGRSLDTGQTWTKRQLILISQLEIRRLDQFSWFSSSRFPSSISLDLDYHSNILRLSRCNLVCVPVCTEQRTPFFAAWLFGTGILDGVCLQVPERTWKFYSSYVFRSSYQQWHRSSPKPRKLDPEDPPREKDPIHRWLRLSAQSHSDAKEWGIIDHCLARLPLSSTATI